MVNDIQLSNSTLSIAEGTKVTINLGGYTLDRGLTKREYNTGGQVFTVRKGATLNLSNGTLKGGWGGDGGGLCNEGGTANLTNVTITGCTGDYRGGGIWNYGTLNIDGCTITDNTASNYGGGIWQKGKLNIQGEVKVTGNKGKEGMTDNIYLKKDAVITVTGALTGSSIGVTLEENTGTFTRGYNTNNSDVDPSTLFSSDMSPYLTVSPNGDEAKVTKKDEKAVYYIDRNWDWNKNRLVSSVKTVTNYTELTGGNSIYLNDGFYVVKGNVTYDHIDIDGIDGQKLILCDGASLTVKYINMLEQIVPLTIYGQQKNSGTLYATDAPDGQAGIGGSRHSNFTSIAIHGGHIIAKGGDGAAGIGAGGEGDREGTRSLFDGIFIYGGIVEATGGSNAAGIGLSTNVRFMNNYNTVCIFGGEVIANGGEDGAGIGGGEGSYGGTIEIYGGTVRATGDDGAGIGSGDGGNGGVITINGGNVYASGDAGMFCNGAGIGGGVDGNGGTITINGGYVEARGGSGAAGIGGGENGSGANVNINGGTIHASAGGDDTGYRAIGPGKGSDNYGTLTIADLMMVRSERIFSEPERVNGCWYRTNVYVEPCTHPGYTADTCPYHKHLAKNALNVTVSLYTKTPLDAGAFSLDFSTPFRREH